MKTRYLIIVFGISLAILLMAKMPLSVVLETMVLPAGEVTFGRVEGTIREGEVKNVVLRGISLGNASLRLNPWSILSLRPRFDWRLSGGAVSGRGILAAAMTDRLMRVTDAEVAADLSRLPTIMPLGGIFAVSVNEFTWDGQGCASADVMLSTNALERNPAGFDWHGPVLDGHGVCEGGSLMFTLAGTDGDTDIGITGRLSPDTTYRLDILMETGDADLKNILPIMGFTADGGRYRATFEGLIGIEPWP